MAGGWARDGAVQDQIDASVEDAVQQARSRLPNAKKVNESLTQCEECDKEIPAARRKAIPGVRLCVPCQSALDEEQTTSEMFNRRGSKDSQLR